MLSVVYDSIASAFVSQPKKNTSPHTLACMVRRAYIAPRLFPLHNKRIIFVGNPPYVLLIRVQLEEQTNGQNVF